MEVLAVLGSLLVSLLSLSGILFLLLKPNLLEKITFTLVSLAAGVLLGSAFFHLLPEALDLSQKSLFEIKLLWIFVIIAILLFMFLEKILNWHHCHNNQHNHKKTLGIKNLIADGVHNFVDGMLIGSAFLVSAETGLITLLAVILHEIPQEISDFGVLIYSGFSKKIALFYNFLSAMLSVLGVLILVLLKDVSDEFLSVMIAFTAGSFIYIALADLVPEIASHTKLRNSFYNFFITFLGLIIVFLLTVLLPHSENHQADHEHLERQEAKFEHQID
jgi:zinc and cadmium transporter